MNKDAKILFGDSKGPASSIGAGSGVLGKRTRRLSDQQDKKYAITSGNNSKQQQVSSISANVTHVIDKPLQGSVAPVI